MEATTILTSAVIATAISAVVSAFVSLRLKDKEYRNDYYKKVIDKRMKVYEYLENQLVLLRAHTLDESDHKMYLKIFAKGYDYFRDSTRDQMLALNSSFWLTYPTHALLAELNLALTELRSRYNVEDDAELIKAGKEYNYHLSTLRLQLEAALRQDMHDLYDVDKFFKARKLPLHYNGNTSEIYAAREQGPPQDPYEGFSNMTFFLPTKK